MAEKKAEKKQKVMEKFQVHKTDTGSPEVQVALLTKRIEELTKHLKEHRHDSDSRRGLLMMVGRRRRLLDYMKKSNVERYDNLIVELGLRK